MIHWDEMSEHERGEHSGRQQVYNALVSMYLDEHERLSATGKVFSRDLVRRQEARTDVLVWAAMITWDLKEKLAAERLAEDLQERMIARAD